MHRRVQGSAHRCPCCKTMHSERWCWFSMRTTLILLLCALSVPCFWAHEVGTGTDTVKGVAGADSGDMGDTVVGDCSAVGDGECMSHSHRSQSLPSLAVGATYQTRFEFPLIGDYIVTMKIVRENRASLDVDGGYPIRDYFQYQLLDHDAHATHKHDHGHYDHNHDDHSHHDHGHDDHGHDHSHNHDDHGHDHSHHHDGHDHGHNHDHPEYLHFSVVLSEELNAILHQFTVSLTEIQYDPEHDVVSAMVSILYVLTFPIRLRRVVS